MFLLAKKGLQVLFEPTLLKLSQAETRNLCQAGIFPKPIFGKPSLGGNLHTETIFFIDTFGEMERAGD